MTYFIEASTVDYIKVNSLELFTHSRQVSLNKQPIYVTGLEYSLLLLLMQKSPAVVTKREIANCIFDGILAGNKSSLFTHISNLRRKLKSEIEQVVIQSIRGQGYCLIGSN